VHLLRPVDLAAAPTIGEVAGDLRAAISGRVLLAWFAEVEIAFLRRIYGGSERAWRRRTVDVRDLAIAVDHGPASARAARGYGLTATAERYGVPVANPHDALDDALVTAQLFLVLAAKLPDRPRPSVGDLLQLSR
jgi:DNA polymerase-3 subunit epsilon